MGTHTHISESSDSERAVIHLALSFRGSLQEREQVLTGKLPQAKKDVWLSAGLAGKRSQSLSFQKSSPRFTGSRDRVNKRSLWGLVSDVALGMIRMPLTSAESSSGRMAPQLLKPHQAIAVLLKIKSRCLAGKRRREEEEEGKEAKTEKRWLQLNSSFFYAFPVF